MGQGFDEGALVSGDGEGDAFAALAVGSQLDGRDGQLEVLGVLHVGETAVGSHQLGDVEKPGESGLVLVAVALGVGFESTDDFAECRGPGVEVREPLAFQQVGGEVALEDVGFGH